MKKLPGLAVSLLLAVTVGCGSSQEPANHGVVPSVVPFSDAGSYCEGDANHDSDREVLQDAALYADGGHDAANPADPPSSCFECPVGQAPQCAALCTEIGGYMTGDGYPYQCCHW